MGPSGPVAFPSFSIENGPFRDSITRIEPFAGGQTDGLKRRSLTNRQPDKEWLGVVSLLLPWSPQGGLRPSPFPILLEVSLEAISVDRELVERGAAGRILGQSLKTRSLCA